MKAFFQALAGIIAAIALAFAFKYVYTNAMGTNETANILDEYGTLMLESRELFIEHSEDIMDLALAIHGYDGLELLRGADGEAFAVVDGQAIPAQAMLDGLGAPEDTAELLERVLEETDVSAENSDGEELLNTRTHFCTLSVTPEAVILHGPAHERGAVGVLYVKDDSIRSQDGLELIELAEEWQLFYTTPD